MADVAGRPGQLRPLPSLGSRLDQQSLEGPRCWVQATAFLLGGGLRSLEQAGKGSFEGEVVVVDSWGRVLAGSGYSALLCLGEVSQGEGRERGWFGHSSFPLCIYIGEGDLFAINTLFVGVAMVTNYNRISRINTICVVLPGDKSHIHF
jgi:hypothetical protein